MLSATVPTLQHMALYRLMICVALGDQNSITAVLSVLSEYLNASMPLELAGNGATRVCSFQLSLSLSDARSKMTLFQP
jgi:hypothetical protein